VVLTGPLLAATLLQAPVAFGALAALKAVLYLRPARLDVRRMMPAPRLLLVGRVLLGLLLPFLILWLAPGTVLGGAMLLAVVGEALDRAEFYQNLHISTPSSLAAEVAASWSSDLSGVRTP
jgi:hypothetical protein